MSTIFLVQAEHPFQEALRQHVHLTREGAERQAVELVNLLLDDFWPIYDEDDLSGPRPVATLTNWQSLVDKYGYDEDFVQEDDWGSWFVVIAELPVVQ